jgi:hypothetical protein
MIGLGADMTNLSAPLSFLGAVLWGLCVLLAMIGWGTAINRILLRERVVDWGWRAAWGFAFSACLGGLLNLAELVSRPTVMLLLGAGLALLALGGRGSRVEKPEALFPWRFGGSHRITALALWLVVLLIAIRYFGTAVGREGSFNSHDDFHAYLVFPTKMLQTGSMGSDPFSLRRVLFAGGQGFLQTYLLALLPVWSLNILDAGLGVIVVVGVLLGYFQRSRITGFSASLVLLTFLLVWSPIVNVTSQCLALALFLSLFRVLELPDAVECGPFARPWLVALHVGAICSLKLSLVLACMTMVAVSYGIAIAARPRWQRVRESIAVAILSAAFFGPWMIDMYWSNGTAFYPLLGKGYAAYAYGEFADPYGAFNVHAALRGIPVFPLTIMAGLSFLAGSLDLSRWRENGPRLALLVAALVGTAAIVAGLNGTDSYRYVYPFVFAPILIELSHALSMERNLSVPASARRIIAAATAGVMMVAWINRTVHMYAKAAKSIFVAAVRDPTPAWNTMTDQTRMMQRVIPPGATLLARLERPFLLDFRRNRVYIIDWPGGASLLPGMPFFTGSEPLARYLLANSIRYIAYDYASEANFSSKRYSIRLEPSKVPAVRNSARLTFEFQDNLAALGNTRKRIYDDGATFVLDLSERASSETEPSVSQ